VNARRRWTLVGLAAAAALAGLLWLMRAPAVRVELGAVERGPLETTVDEEGRTRVRRRYVVAAPVSGRLERIALDEGDALAAGEVVARISPAPLDPRSSAQAQARLEAATAARREAQARVAQARAALAQAERERARARTLAAQHTLSAQALEQAELAYTSRAEELRAAREGEEAAAHEMEAARAALLSAGQGEPEGALAERGSQVEVLAPAAGRVLRVFEESSRVVAVGTPLLELGDPTDLEIVVDVLSADAVKVRPGAEMRLEAWGGEAPLRAVVRRVEPSGFTKLSALGVEEQRVNVIADVLDPPGALGDGYRLEARIVVWRGDDVLRCPASALFRRGGRWHVFAAENGRARLLPVEVGHRGVDAVEILGGLEAGTAVVLHPTDRLADGVRVRPFGVDRS
jgi:HlyD family secretion protein